MSPSIARIVHSFVVFVLLVVLVLVIWQPVFPSGWIIQGMATQIEPHNLALEKPAVLRFELVGRGGGTYNLVLSREKVEVTEGDTNQVDLIIATKATEFNQLFLQLAQGKADEFTFAKLVISNTLKIAGDMSILEVLNSTGKGEQ